jgi:PAS domain S-box-containing protein
MSKILMVDGRDAHQELSRILLTYGGHQVIEAHEGGEALDLAHARHPDLVFTGIVVPGMDGYQLARELRAAPDTATTPIVFHAANRQEAETRPFAETCGGARVLLRSADPEMLMETVDELLAEKRDTDYEHLRAVSAKVYDKGRSITDTEKRFRLMADSSPVGIVFGGPDGRATYVNARLSEITRRPADDLLGHSWLGCADDAHRAEILRAARGAGPADLQHRCRICVAEDPRWLNVHVQVLPEGDEPAGFIATIDDVTTLVDADRQRLDAERQHDIDARDRATERLDSLSTLAGGVARDFTTILGSILASESFVSDSVHELTAAGVVTAETGEALLTDLTQIRNGGQRATSLTQRLLAVGGHRIIDLSAR